MNFSMIVYLLGWVLKIEAAFFILPMTVSLIYQEHVGLYYLICAVFSLLLGLFLSRKKPKNSDFFAKEGFVTVSLCWIVISLISALPFCLSREIPNYTNALFETISGYTTTGASILTDVEVLSHTALFWRSFTHWVGGMGVLVFMLAILPLSGGQNMLLMRMESPGPSVGKFVPKLQTTAVYLYGIYLTLTVVEFIVLLIAKMPVFDAVCTAFGTAGTGGFGIRNSSIAGYSAAVQIIVTVFMLLFGINFNFYFLFLMRHIKDALKMEEVRVYFGIVFAAIAVIAVNIYSMVGSVADSIRLSAFQVASIVTTTGFATTDFNEWPALSKGILLLLMVCGACAGSTGGGMKTSRIMIYVKSIKMELSHLIHPRSVKALTLEHKVVNNDTLHTTFVFLMSYVLIIIVSFLLLCLDGFDMETNFTAVLATLNNIGPGLSVVGPTGNFSGFSSLSKYVLMFNMLAGRLEIFPMLLLFAPATWKKI